MFAERAESAIRPSFVLDHRAWDATHIVVASERDKIDGVVTVLECWKGNLKSGDSLTVPGLAGFATEGARLIEDTPWWDKQDAKPRRYVSGLRMVLFLKRGWPSDRDGGATNVLPEADGLVWIGAADYGGIKVSVAWIEQQEAFAFVQIENPGPSRLVPLRMSEQKLKDRALEVVKTQEVLNRSLTMPAAKRAEALEPLARLTMYPAWVKAFDALADCGPAALPTLRRMLADESTSNRHDRVVKALVRAGGTEVGRDLTQLVERELGFWKNAAPQLRVGWWNGTGLQWSEVEPLRSRYAKVYEALHGLRAIRWPGCEKEVSDFRDFWRSLPQLEDKSGMSQMSEVCDVVLRQLRE
jgi:hypothetical protein